MAEYVCEVRYRPFIKLKLTRRVHELQNHFLSINGQVSQSCELFNVFPMKLLSRKKKQKEQNKQKKSNNNNRDSACQTFASQIAGFHCHAIQNRSKYKIKTVP